MREALGVVIASFVVVVILLVAVSIFGSFGGVADSTPGDRHVEYDAARLEGADTWASFGDSHGRDETAWQTTGFAMEFTGANDSELSGQGWDMGNQTDWHVSVWAEPDQSASDETMKVAAISDGELVIYYDGSASEWRAWYYKESTRNTYEVAVATSSPTDGMTNIQVRANGTDLFIYRNTTAGGTTSIETSSTVTAPTDAANWDGRVEELRTFNASLGSADRQDLFDNPTEQQPTLARTSRLMFDQPNTTDSLVLVSGGTASATNVTFTAGFPADEMQPQTAENDFNGVSDYRWSETGPSIYPLSGGELDGAPVAYASYTAPPAGVSLSSFVTWIQFAALIPVIAMVSYIISKTKEF